MSAELVEDKCCRCGELTDYTDLDEIEAFEKHLICNLCWLEEDFMLRGYNFEYEVLPNERIGV